MSEYVCSILVPSRGPLPRLRDMLESLCDCTAFRERVELVLRFDIDDPELVDRCEIPQRSVGVIPTHVIVGNQIRMGEMTVEMVKHSHGRSIWLMNDDVIHETYGWDIIVDEVTRQRPGHAFFPDDGMFSPQLACFPLLPSAHAKATDCFGIGRYERYLIDSIISDLYSFTLDRLVFLPQSKIRHLNAQPVSTLDSTRWFRACVNDPTHGYQPVENDMLERDKVKYLEQQHDVKRMADAIRALEEVTCS